MREEFIKCVDIWNQNLKWKTKPNSMWTKDVGEEGERPTKQVSREGSLGWEKRQENWLKHCWGWVREINGGLLYHHMERCGQWCDLLMVPWCRTKLLMHLDA
ncbi:hypothetical protein KOW79_010960 [Hemibagrus wyckioides]|uniref:Uncharacterized protein n=1 Tax=Hemibagrus wyckioides TaxID=337641 RepID=A0A9D3NPL3_9TELE|nr:hypothetical protein KOW79_010960 [Hemibagrus wyckioides]